MSRVINAALVGFGLGASTFHAPFIVSNHNFKLVKVMERHSENSKKLYPWVEVTKTIDDIVNDEKIELVVISVPNKFHYELAKKALLHNKNVIVDKPFTVTSREAEELIGIAKEKEKIIIPYQNRRFDGDFQTVKKVIESGTLGDVVEYEAHFDRFRNFVKANTWKEEDLEGAGILYDLGSHLIDQAVSIFGIPEYVFGDIRIQREEGKVPDSFEVILSYKKVKATLKASMFVKEPLPRFIVLGSEGSFVKYGTDVQEENLRKGIGPSSDGNWGKEDSKNWGILNTNFQGLNVRGTVETLNGNYNLFYDSVYSSIVNGGELLVSESQAINTIKIIEAAIKSSKEKVVVKL